MIKITFTYPLSWLILLLIAQGCTVGPVPDDAEKPYLRIGILQNQNSIELRADKDFDIHTYNGASLGSGKGGDRCELTVIDGRPATIRYCLIVREVSDEEETAKIVNDVKNKGFGATIKKRKTRIFHEGRLGNFLIYQICIDREFTTEEAAEQYRSQIQNKLFTRVISFMKAPPAGIVRLKNLRTGKSVQSDYFLRVSGDRLNLDMNIESGESRIYQGHLNFVVDGAGKLTVVNELPIEEYLKGVISSEMNSKFPLEALKAQTLAARGFTLSRIGKQHSSEPFDLCDEVHCQVFKGITNSAPSITRAVKETNGEVLMYDGAICETYYSGVCGGHTEHNENVWNGNPIRYLRGVFDFPQNKIRVDENFLMNEENLYQWIVNRPTVHCNIDTANVPSYLSYARKYFRWEVEYTQNQLKNIIARKTGTNFGEILDIVPIERGISGRLKKIRIQGTLNSKTIEKELQIRRVFSDNYLYSSCFIIKKDGLVGGVPQKFIIKGAGWGHGVGMCQIGAAMMADQGFNYHKILQHYYRESTIKKIYE